MYQILDSRLFKLKKFMEIQQSVPFDAKVDDMLVALKKMRKLRKRFPGLKLRVYKETKKETKQRLETDRVFTLLEKARKSSEKTKRRKW